MSNRFRFDDVATERQTVSGARRGMGFALLWFLGWLFLIASTAVAWRYVNAFCDWLELVTR